MINKKIPSYLVLPILILSLLIYFMLIFPPMSMMIVKNLPVRLNEYTEKIKNNQEFQRPLSHIDFMKFRTTTLHEKHFYLFFIITIICGDIFFILMNLPFKIYFYNKRRNKNNPEIIKRLCRKFLKYTPIANGILFFLIFLIVNLYIALMLTGFRHEMNFSLRNDIFATLLFISILSSLIASAFIYFWQKQRTQFFYLKHIIADEDQFRKNNLIKSMKIRRYFIFSTFLSVILPLLLILIYIFLNISIKDLTTLTPAEQAILVGDMKILIQENADNLVYFFGKELFYIDFINTTLMLAGLAASFIIAFIFIFFFGHWTQQRIVQPVNELLENMSKMSKGNLSGRTIVRTNDEIGELVEGYNLMAENIDNQLKRITHQTEAYSRFVPRQFLEYLGKDKIEEITLGDRTSKEMTILFSDIADFTTITENMDPAENFNFINTYLSYMEPIIGKNKGFIDKYLGDGIMALFPDSADDALNSALSMLEALNKLNKINKSNNLPEIKIRLGIHTGNLMLGVIGGNDRMESTVISDAVNTSSRLEGLNKIYGSTILISEMTLHRLNEPDNFKYRFIDLVKVKGKKEPLSVFEILNGDPENICDLKLKTRENYELGIYYYQRKNFKESLLLFKKVLKENHKDQAALVLAKRCLKIIKYGLPKGWDGTENINVK